ncbi:hypothetical protein F5X99DRAFT_115444 [Biscogniauxia marginata]|nr:hypothetical protein F5X99DRAFT_115444 [Biscogniauxia marginata]
MGPCAGAWPSSPRGDPRGTREPVEDIEFGPYHQPANFVEKDIFLFDLSVLGAWANPYNQDIYRARTVDLRSGSRDAASLDRIAKIKNVAFLSSDAASMYLFLVAVVNIQHPPAYNMTPEDKYDPRGCSGRSRSCLLPFAATTRSVQNCIGSLRRGGCG